MQEISPSLLIISILLLYGACFSAASPRYGTRYVSEWTDEVPNAVFPSDADTLFINNPVYTTGYPSTNWIDFSWQIDLATPDLHGFHVKWVENDNMEIITECFVLGNGNNTLFSTYTNACQQNKTELVACEHVWVVITPENKDGVQIGTQMSFSPMEVPLPEDLNMACWLRLYPTINWIRAEWTMLKANQGSVKCDVSWMDEDGNLASQCQVDCQTIPEDVYLGVDHCDPTVNLMPNSLYTITVQPVDDRGEKIGTSVAGNATTLPVIV